MSGYDFNEHMNYIGYAGERVTKAALTEGKKAKDKFDLERAIHSEQKRVEALYAKIGKELYEENKDDPDNKYADIMQSITDSLLTIEDYKEKVREMKEQ
ncbi:MAG: hypothetical protein K6F37_00395 [Lachnospiraceae bacterium]|nr:hypothetical protein [Lachnospiraceae bacterium]